MYVFLPQQKISLCNNSKQLHSLEIIVTQNISLHRLALVHLPVSNFQQRTKRNPLQLFTVLAGLALATALWSGVQAINAEARASYRMAADMLGAADRAQITTHAGGRVSVADYVALRRGGWRVSPVLEGRYDGIRILGIDPLTVPRGGGGLPEFNRTDIGGIFNGSGSNFWAGRGFGPFAGQDFSRF